MFDRIYQQHWINLPSEVRLKLAEIFNIEKTGITEIRDQTLIADGTTNTDLAAITLEKMEVYTGKKGSFVDLWHTTLEDIDESLHPTKKDEPLPEVIEETKDEQPVKAKK